MVKKKFIIAVICSFYFSIYPFAIWAEERDFSGELIKKKSAENGNGEVKRIAEDDKGIFTVALENDLFTGSDSGYTNGARFSYISSESQAPELVKKSSSYLPMLNQEGKKRVSIAVGQDIYILPAILKIPILRKMILFMQAGYIALLAWYQIREICMIVRN